MCSVCHWPLDIGLVNRTCICWWNVGRFDMAEVWNVLIWFGLLSWTSAIAMRRKVRQLTDPIRIRDKDWNGTQPEVWSQVQPSAAYISCSQLTHIQISKNKLLLFLIKSWNFGVVSLCGSGMAAVDQDNLGTMNLQHMMHGSRESEEFMLSTEIPPAGPSDMVLMTRPRVQQRHQFGWGFSSPAPPFFSVVSQPSELFYKITSILRR